MNKKFYQRAKSPLAVLACGLVLGLASLQNANAGADPDADYDRLDGTGASGKKVQVIEWEGNLEIHVYPMGSLKGLALKIDRTNKSRPVMVIGYRFDNAPKKQVIRRNIIDGLTLRDDFKVYRDPQSDGYDKIVITNNNLDQVLTAYKVDPAPTQLYPDGYDAALAAAGGGGTADSRSPASASGAGPSSAKAGQQAADSAAQDQAELQDSGSIRPFMTDGYQGHRR